MQMLNSYIDISGSDKTSFLILRKQKQQQQKMSVFKILIMTWRVSQKFRNQESSQCPSPHPSVADDGRTCYRAVSVGVLAGPVQCAQHAQMGPALQASFAHIRSDTQGHTGSWREGETGRSRITRESAEVLWDGSISSVAGHSEHWGCLEQK